MRARTLVDPFYAWQRIKHYGIERSIIHFLGKGILRRPVNGTIRLCKKVIWFPSYLRRIRTRNSIMINSAYHRFIDQKLGYRICSAGEIPGIEPVLSHCQDLLKEFRKREGDSPADGRSYSELLSPDPSNFGSGIAADLTKHPVLMKFAASRPIMEIAAGYLGELPIVGSIQLYLTHPNDSQVGFQNFHYDHTAPNDLKLFIAVNDIDEQTGPLTWFGADHSDQISEVIGTRIGRANDDDVYTAIGDGKAQRTIGPAGTCFFVDVARCLHYGSRGNTKMRAVVVFEFVSKFSYVESNLERGRILLDANDLKNPLDCLAFNQA